MDQQKLAEVQAIFYKPFRESSLTALICLTATHANKRKMNLADFKTCLEALFQWHSGFRATKKVTQPTLAALLIKLLRLVDW